MMEDLSNRVCVCASVSPSVFSRSASPLICAVIHFFMCAVTMIRCGATRATKVRWHRTPASSSIQRIPDRVEIFWSLEHHQTWLKNRLHLAQSMAKYQMIQCQLEHISDSIQWLQQSDKFKYIS